MYLGHGKSSKWLGYRSVSTYLPPFTIHITSFSLSKTPRRYTSLWYITYYNFTIIGHEDLSHRGHKAYLNITFKGR